MIQENLAAYVADKGIKQKVLAEKVGMTEVAVSSMLRCDRKLTADEYSAICYFLGVSTEKFRDSPVSSVTSG